MGRADRLTKFASSLAFFKNESKNQLHPVMHQILARNPEVSLWCSSGSCRRYEVLIADLVAEIVVENEDRDKQNTAPEAKQNQICRV